jgi:hypothetical protein
MKPLIFKIYYWWALPTLLKIFQLLFMIPILLTPYYSEIFIDHLVLLYSRVGIAHQNPDIVGIARYCSEII